jgi:hypothetical protein
MSVQNERERSVERRVEKIPREITRPCKRCGHRRKELNGPFFRLRRKLAKVTLREMASMFGASGLPLDGVRNGVSLQLLSRMERGDVPFAPKYAEVYDRLFERRERAGGDE